MTRDTRTALLDAAQQAFAAKGFSGTSIRELAAAVGIKESSVYNHFPSKQGLLDAVLQRADDHMSGVAQHFGVPFDDPLASADAYETITLERLEQIALSMLDKWLNDQDVIAAHRILTLEQYRTPQAGRQLRSFLVEQPLAFQSVLFAELIKRDALLPADPEAVALAFWGPVLAILLSADGPDGQLGAERLMRSHLQHFRSTHTPNRSQS